MVAWKPPTFGAPRELKDENHRLKQMYADLSLENRALKDVILQNALSQPRSANWLLPYKQRMD